MGLTAFDWRERRVLVTGHTGFKGSWLCLMLARAGAKVTGLALPPPTDPNMFDVARVAQLLDASIMADVRDADAVRAVVSDAAPEIVFHLAAQPLVRDSYAQPVETYAVNVLGTAHVLEAVRQAPSVRAVVNVTTDKCYANNEWDWGYRESEPLGGHDPYSSSKACAELVTAAYRASFLAERGIGTATARAGNVIGGGDWARDRLVPDFFRAAQARQPLTSRAPGAIRPWQHVLEPVSGYVRLGEALLGGETAAADAWNFGPVDEDARPVGWILDELTALFGGPGWTHQDGRHVHEAHFLKLDSSKARARLGWHPVWRLREALSQTCAWQRAWLDGQDMQRVSLAQIAAHEVAVRQ